MVKDKIDDRKLVIERVFDAPRALVWKVWTDPDHTKHWLAPRGMTVAEWKNDARPGGAWLLRMAPPGGPEHRAGGVNREIVPGEKLVFTHSWLDDHGKPGHETLVTVSFADAGGKTKVHFEQATFESIQDRDGHRDGWNECLDKLAERIATLL